MARARNIKPGFFSNEELVELDMATRLLFIGLWTIADRDGRMEDRPKRIKMQVFPADDVDIDASLAKLDDRGFIQRYEVDGMYCIQVVNWKKHQSPHIKETASTIPSPAGTLNFDQKSSASTGQAPDENTASRPDSLIADSLIADSYPPSPQGGEDTGIDGDDDSTIDITIVSLSNAQERRFIRFWDAYPRKISKQRARRWFARHKPSDALVDAMVAAIETQGSSPDWHKDGGQYIPHPASWLNAGGWDNESPAPVVDALDDQYLTAFGERNADTMAAALDLLDPSFGGCGWVRASLRRLVRDVPGLSQPQLKRGLSLGLDRIEARFGQTKERAITNPQAMAYAMFRAALDEQREAVAA